MIQFKESAFWEKVAADGSCLIYQGTICPKGYGIVNITRDGRHTTLRAHRLAWLLAHEEEPLGMQVDHMCHNRACVNAEHLRLVTNKQNSENRRGPNRGSASGERNVYAAKGGGWHVKARSLGRDFYAGRFDSLSDARQAAINLRNSIFTHNIERKAS